MASNRDMTEQEEKVYNMLYHQAHSVLKPNQDYPRNRDQFDNMVKACGLNGCMNKLQDMFPDPMDAVIVLKGLVESGWITETKDTFGYPAFVPSTHMVIEEVKVIRKSIPVVP